MPQPPGPEVHENWNELDGGLGEAVGRALADSLLGERSPTRSRGTRERHDLKLVSLPGAGQ